jgi:hypothetical protein
VANALADMARGTGPVGGALTVLFGQLDRLASYVATFATLMAGRKVPPTKMPVGNFRRETIEE